jgi:predicted PurR-regulated permease PerM
LLPTVSAFVVFMMRSPLSAEAERRRIPSLLSAIVLWLLAVAIFYGVIIMLSAPAVDWISKAPEIGRSIQDKLRVLDQPLSALKDMRNALLPEGTESDVGIDVVSILQPAVSVVTPAIGELFIVFAALFFMLLGRARIRRGFVAYFKGRDARLLILRIINDFEQNLAKYLSTVTLINIVVGVAAGAIAWLVGLPQPTAWAVLGFVLNSIPYIGALIVEIGMFLVGLVTFPTVTHATIAPLLFVALATFEGQFVTPSIVGRRITLNPLVVFLSLVFWTWLWGPVGAFLAAPMLIMVLAATGELFPKDAPILPD